MVTSTPTTDWLNWVSLTPIPLRRMSKAGVPVGSASGCLVDYAGRRFLLSVEHAIGRRTKGWVIQMETSHRGTEIFRLRGSTIGLLMKRAPKPKPMDLCYIEVPPDLTAVDCQLTPRGAGPRRARPVFPTDLSAVPTVDDIYAFAGHVMLELHGKDTLSGDMVVYPGLKFSGARREYHEYRLPVAHPGHQHFRGCSGAPIVNRTNQVVGIVCGGNLRTNCIRAMPLSWFKVGIDFLCANTAPMLPLGPKGVIASCEP